MAQSKMLSTISSDTPSKAAVLPAAVEGTQLLFKLCRRRKDIDDPRQFVFAIAYVLNGYSEEVIRFVTDPMTGLPGSLRYPLEVADVQRACAARQATLAFEEKWRREDAARAAAAAEQEARTAQARLEIVHQLGQLGHDGEAVFGFLERQYRQNADFILDRHSQGRPIEGLLHEAIGGWMRQSKYAAGAGSARTPVVEPEFTPTRPRMAIAS
jgi:hypothetical protein